MLGVALAQVNQLPRLAAPLAWQPTRLTWQTPGGPWRAEFEVAGAYGEPVGALQALLGSPVTVTAGGQPAWWGFVQSVQVQRGRAAIQYTLDGLANRVAVRYRRGGPGGGDWQQTPWAAEAASQARFGVFERVVSLAEASPEQAAAERDALLARLAWPCERASVAPESTGAGWAVRLQALGWWHSLGRVRYAPAVGLVEHSRPGGWLHPLGDAPAQTSLAQSFTPGEMWEAGQAWLRVARSGSPADALRVELCADGGGVPGAALAAVELTGAALPGEPAWVACDFVVPPELRAGALYWLAARRTGALDAANFYRVSADPAAGFAGGAAKRFDGAAWTALGGDLNFRVGGFEDTGLQIRRLAAAGVPGGPGQCLTGCFAPLTGVSRPLWRDGPPRPAQVELLDLLAAGDSSGAPLEAAISPGRALVVGRQPDPDPVGLMDLQGRALTPTGRPWPLGRQICGRWVGFAASFARRPLYVTVAEWTPAEGLRVVA